jgi:hypothetical protein
MKESDILHETANLYLCQRGNKLELCLNGHTHAVVVGNPKTVEDGKRVMAKLEKYPQNLKYLRN